LLRATAPEVGRKTLVAAVPEDISYGTRKTPKGLQEAQYDQA